MLVTQLVKGPRTEKAEKVGQGQGRCTALELHMPECIYVYTYLHIYIYIYLLIYLEYLLIYSLFMFIVLFTLMCLSMSAARKLFPLRLGKVGGSDQGAKLL